MRVIREIEVGGRKVQVKELSVGEIRAWLAGLGSSTVDAVDVALFEEMSLGELALMTGLSQQDIEAMTPSELAEVLTTAQEVNARFFGMRARIEEMGKRALATPVS